MTLTISPVSIAKPVGQNVTKKSAADITAHYARKALQTITSSTILNNANQYGWLLARGAERQIVSSATVHSAGFLGFSTVAAAFWGLATEIPIKIGETISKLSIPILSENLLNIPFLNIANFGIGVSGISALYCLDQLADTIFGRSITKSVLKHSRQLDSLKPGS